MMAEMWGAVVKNPGPKNQRKHNKTQPFLITLKRKPQQITNSTKFVYRSKRKSTYSPKIIKKVIQKRMGHYPKHT